MTWAVEDRVKSDNVISSLKQNTLKANGRFIDFLLIKIYLYKVVSSAV
jgi:hypothetical protein